LQRVIRVIEPQGYGVPALCTPEELMGETAMKSQGEIVDEVRRVREAYAARFDHDLKRMFEDLQKKEQAHPAPAQTSNPSNPINSKRKGVNGKAKSQNVRRRAVWGLLARVGSLLVAASAAGPRRSTTLHRPDVVLDHAFEFNLFR